MGHKLSTREKKLLLILGVVLSFTLFLRIFWGLQLPRFIELKQQVESQKQSLQQANELLQKLPQLLVKERQVQQELDLLTKEYQGFENGIPFFEIGKRAQKVELLGIYPEEVEKRNGFFVLPLQIRLKGQYLEVLDFLHQMENLPFLAEITLPRIEAIEQEGMVSAQFLLNLYFAEMTPIAHLTEQRHLGKFDVFRYPKQDYLEQEGIQENKISQIKNKAEEAKVSQETVLQENKGEQYQKEKPQPALEKEQERENPAIRYNFPVK